MIPVSLLLALLLAFGFEPPPTGVPQADVGTRVLETCGGITLVAALAFGLGFWVAFQVSHAGHATSRLRRRYAVGARLLTMLSLVVYGWIIHSVGWSKLVQTNWGLSRLILVDDFVVFLPYLLIQLLVWWGLFFAERALQVRLGLGSARGLGRYLLLRARQSLGLILPVILMYVLRRDVLGRFFPGWDESAVAEPIEIAVFGTLVLAMSPLFVRLAWPARSLPPGPLRRRLERIAERVGFRFTDILVWDTGGMVVNACVTGILPGFRYVLLSDALLESLTPLEAAAVFGHEIGHVAHRHFLYFAFFFMGSLGLLSLLAEILSKSGPLLVQFARLSPWSPSVLSDVIQGVALLIALGLYFWVVFGHLSRRFERQADVFGSKVVSCDLEDCPPHIDLDTDLSPQSIRGRKPTLCPVGIRIFAEALANVARSNGLNQNGRSWRHGSIANRIAFLEGLERHPEREHRFQKGVLRLRLGLGVVLALAVLLSVVTQTWGLLR
ncbi:MAG: M48 family metallopeptidase [Isosphaerales bacterium]